MAFEKPGFRDLYAALETDLRRRAPALTDWEEGSVVRSLFESFAFEMALLYEQMESVYNAGYVDTATGANLERVVAVLGITRNEPDFATGVVTFERDPGASAAVTVPAGTLVTTPEQDGARKAYLTIEDAVLEPGATAAEARVQAEERGAGMIADSGTVTVMPRPVPGVKTVRNARPIRFLGRERETDEELRDRARNALLASGRASETSIENALLGLPGVRGVRVVEDFSTGAAEATEAAKDGGTALGRGAVRVFVDGLTPENAGRLRERVDEVRAAGVLVLMEPAVPVNVEAVLRIEADPRVRGEELATLEAHVADAVERALDRQRMGEPLLFSQLTKEVLGVEGVTDLVDFRVITFREGRTPAEGKVTLTRAAAGGALPVKSLTELRTKDQQRFQTVGDWIFEPDDLSLAVPVRALRQGRDGELMRTGAAVAWEPREVDGTPLTIRNEAPIRLPRVVHLPDERRVEASVEQRFTADRVRVAAGGQTLAVHVRVRVELPPAAGAASAAAARAVDDALAGGARAAAPAEPWLEKMDTTGTAEVQAVVDGWFATVRAAAAALGPLAGELDAAATAALVAEVGAYFAEAKAASPVQIVEDRLRARLESVLAARLTPAALAAAIEPQATASLAVLRAGVPPFPTGAVEDALRAALRRASDDGSKTQADAAKTAEADLRKASDALTEAAGKLRAAPTDPSAKNAVSTAEANMSSAQAAYESAARALEQARTSAAQTLATQLARVPDRAAKLEASARAELDRVLPPALADAVTAAVAAAAKKGSAFTVGVRLRTVGYDGDIRPDQPFVEPSFVETPEAATVFVYTRTLPVSGTLALTLPFTATEADRQRIRAEVAQAIGDYLDALGPEEGVVLETMRTLAAANPQVVSAGDFIPAPALRSRLDRAGKVLSIRPLEKAVLDVLVLEG